MVLHSVDADWFLPLNAFLHETLHYVFIILPWHRQLLVLRIQFYVELAYSFSHRLDSGFSCQFFLNVAVVFKWAPCRAEFNLQEGYLSTYYKYDTRL